MTSRLRFLILAGGIILLGWLALPAHNAYPQGTTVTPFPTTDNTAMVVGLPFGDSFDETEERWTPSGAWYFDEEGGYNGSGGWVLDGTQANLSSTLEYVAFMDLHGSLRGQIMFRQRGNLPTSDLIAVEISLDGGQTWFLVDSQVGVEPGEESDMTEALFFPTPTPVLDVTPTEPGDIPQEAAPENPWWLHKVSLRDYRNQVIRLRIRVQTGARLPDENSLNERAAPIRYQIDNLSIQYVADAMVLAPVFPGPRTLLGLHLIVGAQEGPVLALVKQLREVGWPMGTLKGTSGTEKILADVKSLSPETIIVYRSLETARGMIDCPNSFADPIVEANDWMGGLWPEWEGVTADYFEIMNECFPPFEWLIPFTIEAMRLATERGYCLLVFSFAAGNPEPYQYGALRPVYEFALTHPCRSGWVHGIAFHSYSGEPNRLISESDVWLGQRYQLYYAHLLPVLPEATRLPVFLTETGPGDGRTPFRCDEVVRDMIQYTQQLEKDPYIAGFHLWNVGPSDSHWVDVTNCLPMLGDALIRYYTGG